MGACSGKNQVIHKQSALCSESVASLVAVALCAHYSCYLYIAHYHYNAYIFVLSTAHLRVREQA